MNARIDGDCAIEPSFTSERDDRDDRHGDPDEDPDGVGGEGGAGVRDLRVVLLSPRSVCVSWRTPAFEDSVVRYGKDATLAEAPIHGEEKKRRHAVLLTDLEPAGTYFCQASSSSGGAPALSKIKRFTTLPAPSYSVRESHPRIFFTGEDLPSLKEKIRGSHARYWRVLIKYVNSTLSKSALSLATDDNLVCIGRSIAFAGLVGDSAELRQKALEIALESASLSLTDSFPRRRSLLLMATIYDWLYADLSDSDRKTLRQAILERLQSFHPNDREFLWGWNPECFSPITIGALAIYGEAPEAQDYLDTAISRYRYEILPAWRHYASDGGSNEGWWYSTFHLDMLVEALGALETATDAHLLASESWMSKAAGWFAAGLRSDHSFQRFGDSKIFKGVHYMNRRFAAFVAKTFQDPQAQWLANKMESILKTWGPTALYDILCYDPDLGAKPPFEKTTQFYPEAGFLCARDNWGKEPVQVMFHSAREFTLGHTHRDNNSFTMYYKGGQAINSGLYDSFSSEHHSNYYERTVAHNTLLVFDPRETFRRYAEVHANDGGQQYLRSPEQVPHVMPGTVEDILDPRKGYQAGGIHFEEETAAYTYAMGDAAPSYSREKLTVFDRHLVFLKKAAGYKKPLLVVFDRVVSTNPSFKKTYLLHTQNKPDVVGALVAATNGQGMLYQQTLLPAAAAIEVVGGPGREFWVNGRNYAPMTRPGPLDEAGQYRVEVSPSVPALEDYFLHLLCPADRGAPTVPLARRIEASSMRGLKAGDWLLLFPAGKTGVSEVAYDLPGGKCSHLLVGMLPLAIYSLVLNGEKGGEKRASYEGTLCFKADGSGRIAVKTTGISP